MSVTLGRSTVNSPLRRAEGTMNPPIDTQASHRRTEHYAEPPVVPENPSLLTDLTFARLACMVDRVTSPYPDPCS